MRLQFGTWAPDSAGIDNNVLTEARNVFPYAAGYGPIPELTVFSSTALPTKCLGLFSAKTASGGWVVFAGTATKLYKLVDTTWTDFSRLVGGNYGANDDNKWSFTQFGSRVIVGQLGDVTQYIDIDTGSANFAALPNAPRARYWTTVGDFLIAASISTDTRAVKNSAINDSEGWTVGTNLCDQQSFPDGGRVTGMVGGEFGYVAQERAFRRMIFQPGSDYAFRFEQIDRERGCAAGYSLVGVGPYAFFLSDDGFYRVGADGVNAIGAEVFNTWFASNSDAARFFEVLGFRDPFGPRIGWAFYNTSGDANYTYVLIYNWKTDKASYAIMETQYIASYATAGVSLEALDVYGSLEDVPFSLDSRVWEGGLPALATVNSAGYLSFLDGTAALTALIKTNTQSVNPGWRSKNFDIKPLGEFNGATLGIRIGKREHTKNAWSYTDSLTPSTLTGWARGRASGFYHTMELTITQSTGTRWTLAQGLEIEATRDGKK